MVVLDLRLYEILPTDTSEIDSTDKFLLFLLLLIYKVARVPVGLKTLGRSTVNSKVRKMFRAQGLDQQFETKILCSGFLTV